MPATPIATTTRFFNADLTVVVFAPVVASTTLAATRAEINAGTDLSKEIADWSGWTVTGGVIATPGLTKFDGNIPGKITVDDSSLTFYGTETGADVRTLLARGVSGYIIIMDGGDVAGRKMDVFPVRSRSVGKLRSVGEDAFRLMVPFSIPRQPAEDVTIPV